MIPELNATGMSKNEIIVYIEILKLGRSTVGPIAAKTKLYKQSVYNTISKLKEKGFIDVELRNNRNYYFAKDPECLVNSLESKKSQINSILPELYALQGIEKHISDIKVYVGLRAFSFFHEKMLKQSPKNEMIKVIGAGGNQFLSIMKRGVFFTRYENIRNQRNISHQLLMYENQRNTDPDYINRRNVEVKYLPSNFNQPYATQIWNDRIAIILFSESPQIIEIKKPAIHKSFSNYFEVLWETAKA